ncbi:MAG: 16S rRNA (uracil(1498)-N(3))-methyltransferase [Pseudomonadota bacterium]
MADAKIRLFVDHPLDTGKPVPVDRDQANYLFNVMRLTAGAKLLLFNSKDGEWLAEVAQATKRRGLLTCVSKTRALFHPPDLWLLFAPIKKARTDFIVEKATELGAARIIPVQTEFTNSERLRQDRLQAHAIEAAEQCGSTYVPDVLALQKLSHVLQNWPQDRQLLFCDEVLAGTEYGFDSALPGKWGILIGPEGGFSDAERTRLLEMPQTKSVALGPRILRADTAAVAAMSLWQSKLGDWNEL